jgi:tRNA pseudouridine55 synthase
MDGAIILDKPSGMTSMDVIRVARRKCNIRRVGHSGTLDPLATGLLVVLFGRATKLQNIFLNARKSYSGLIRLGLRTETYDIQGVNHSRTEVPPQIAGNPDILKRIEETFSGPQKQLPPVYSALKVAGVASHKLAREGVEVELEERDVEIVFDDLRFHSAESIRFEVSCSKGTYIRSLARDIGEELGCGACIESLRRTASNPFKLESAVTLDTFLENDPQRFLLGMDKLVSHLPRVDFDGGEFSRLEQGQQQALEIIELDREDTMAAVFNDGQFGGLIEKRNRGWKLRFLVPSAGE